MKILHPSSCVMVEPEILPSPSSPSPKSQQFVSQNILIGISSFLFILVITNPWIIVVTVISFAVGFTCVEHLDKCIKSSIVSGRFGKNVQNYFKDHINSSDSYNSVQKNVIKKVTADPLRDILELEESKKQHILQTQQQQSPEVVHSLASNRIQVHHHSLAIPAEGIPSSTRSSPEKSKSSRGSPVRNVSSSATSSRRVSDDILGNNLRRESNNKTPSPSKSSQHGSTPSPSLALPAEISALRIDQEFRLDVRVDKAFGRLFTNILNYYISSSWAPYETRRQLRLSFKQLLTSVAEHINNTLLVCKSDRDYPPLIKLVRRKLLPLLLYYLDKSLRRGLSANDVDDPIISEDSRKRITLKLRKFCRQISERFLCKDDLNCKLWMELFIAVLADGVLVNVMALGRDQLPELFEELVTNYKKASERSATTQQMKPQYFQLKSLNVKVVGGDASNEQQQRHMDPLSDNYQQQEEASLALSHQKEETMSFKSDYSHSLGGECNIMLESTAAVPIEKVPFLLDSFLDPPFNFEKPDPIVSRWRPTLKDIVSETELLYSLIQYMKHVGGQQSLAYLQGVLDDYPNEGDPYCRRVLELEYLPGFCRSALLLETMGLNRVEMAMEVAVGPELLGYRRNSGHARSASYGGPSNSSFREFLKIEQGIVDGLPLTESGSHLNSLGSSSDQSTGGGNGTNTTGATLPGAGAIEPSLAFKRRPHLEMYIAKFIKSTTKSWKQYYDPLADKLDPVKRIGIDAKNYEDWDHPEVNSRVRVFATNEDIYDTLLELVTSLMRNSPVASPFLSGLTYFLKPYLMPVFNSQMDKNLNEVLSVDLLVAVLDLISDVYEESPTADDEDNGEENHKSDINEQQRNPPSRHGPSTSRGMSDEMFSNPDDDTSHHHNSSCTTCDPSLKSTIKSFLKNILESLAVNLIDMDYFVKCCGKNRDYIFLFFVDLLDVIVSEIVEE